MLTKNELIVLYGMRTLDYEKDPNPEHWRTISGAKVHLDNNGEIDGGAGGNFNGNYWDGKKGQQHVIGPHTMMKKNIGSGATNVMLAAGGFLGNALGKAEKEPPKQPPKKENKDFVLPRIIPRTEPRDFKNIRGGQALVNRAVQNVRKYGEFSNRGRLSMYAVHNITNVPMSELQTPVEIEEIEAQFGSAFARANNDKQLKDSDIKKFQEALETFKNADANDRDAALAGINIKTLGKDSVATYKEWLKVANELKKNNQTKSGEINAKEFANEYLPESFNVEKEKKSNEVAVKYINGLTDANPETKNLYAHMNAVTRDVHARIGVIHNGDDGYIKPIWGPNGYTGDICYPILWKKEEDPHDLAEAMCTFFHENMHQLDFIMAGPPNTGSPKPFSLLSKEGAKLETVVTDYVNSGPVKAAPSQEIFDMIQNRDKERIKELNDWYAKERTLRQERDKKNNELFMKYMNGEITKEECQAKTQAIDEEMKRQNPRPHNKKYDGMGNLMDMYDALSDGKFFDYGYNGKRFAGHGGKYYRGSSENKNTELLANWGTLKMINPQLADMFRKDKPDVAEALDKVEAAMLQKAKEMHKKQSA